MSDVKTLIDEVRAGFQALAAFGSALHEDLGVNASMRAVMEYLAHKGPTPAPEMARAKNVSRQHIQTIADQLVAAGLAETRDNPQHKRSVFITLTKSGAAMFVEIETRERAALRKLAARLRGRDLAGASETLAALRAALHATNRS